MNYRLVPYAQISEIDGVTLIDSIANKTSIKISDQSLKSELDELVKNGGCDTTTSPLERCLHQENFLLSQPELMQFLTEVQLLMNRKLLVTIIPTEACNFRCPYCYERHIPITMSKQTISQIKNYISSISENFETVSIAWFGGEPTLCADTVLDVSEFIKTLGKEKSFNFISSMTTNGYLLTKNLFTQFYRAGVKSYQITLDGWTHDKTRTLRSGKETLETILNNLKEISKLSKEDYPFHVTIRHNILKDDIDFSWYDYLHGIFGDDDRFSILVRPVGNWGGETVGKLNLLQGSESEQLILRHIQYIKKIGMKCANGAQGVFSRICYASYRYSMVFRATGKIEKCTVALDHPQNLIGYVDSSKGVVLNENANYQWWHSTLQEKCFCCKELLTCFNMRCKKKTLIDGLVDSTCSSVSLKIY